MTDIEERATNAQVLVTQPFWKELAAHAQELEYSAMRALLDAKHADPLVVKGLQQRWLAIHDTIESLLRYPEAAIQAGKDATPQRSDWPSERGMTQQDEQWQ